MLKCHPTEGVDEAAGAAQSRGKDARRRVDRHRGSLRGLHHAGRLPLHRHQREPQAAGLVLHLSRLRQQPRAPLLRLQLLRLLPLQRRHPQVGRNVRVNQ